jgi:glycosyltransferase involved in cell wall biosynthesis
MLTLQRTAPVCRTANKLLKVMFLHTSVPVGGAETLLVDLVRRLDRSRFAPELCCLKTLGPCGELLAREIPAFHGLIRHKYDAAVILRLARLMREREVDVIVSVGAGDKMFWGRIAARIAKVPVVLCAIHSTGWPDPIGRLNRMLTRWTDAFIALAEPHRRYLIDDVGLPEAKVRIIPNGIDIDRFDVRPPNESLRWKLGLSAGSPVAGIVARLRSEKNIEMFLDVAGSVRQESPDAQFLIVGDGPDRAALEERSRRLGLCDCVRFLGSRSDIPELLSLMEVFLLTSHNEASPVSIREAFAAGKPVVATRVGSVGEVVSDGQNGYLVSPGDVNAMTRRVLELFREPSLAQAMGRAGREYVQQYGSLEMMVGGYEDLIQEIYSKQRPGE